MTLTMTDLFAGAGGSSTGGTQVPGVSVRLAANHWAKAVDVHNANHPGADHLCADISAYDPHHAPKTDILWASPECFAADTLVLTERGLIPIEDVAVGDRVLTHLGRYRKVTATMAKQADTVRLIGQGLSHGLEVTTEHPILTTTGAGVTDWTRVSDVDLDGNSRWATPTEYPASTVPTIGGPRPIHVEDERFAWIVGRWLGDGSLRVRQDRSSETFITCGKHEANDLEKSLTWVHHDCGTCAPEVTWSKRELRTAFVYANSHSELARWLKEHFGQHSHGKTVPSWVLGAPQEWRRALLAGYLSADGHDNGRGWQAASVSKGLALGIRLLAESLDHRVSLTWSHRDTWRIEGRTGRARPQWTVTWLHDIKRATSQTATTFGGHSWGVIKDVEPGTTDTLVYDLTVAEDHSYVADGIVVHNCTNHSKAKGRKRTDGDQPDLFGETLPDAAAERSRATMWDVPRWAEVHQYRSIIVENVVEATKWTPFRHWLGAMDSYGYDHQLVSLNSMHAQAGGLPAPQSRDRLYVVFNRKGDRAPDLAQMQRPKAYCPRCAVIVESRQAFKPGRTVGRYRQQYVYLCSTAGCGTIVEPAWLPAAAAIDWSIQGQKIGDRAKPLAEKTRRRIAAGIARYWGPVHLEAAGHTYDAADPKHKSYGDPQGYYRSWSTDDVLKTLHTLESKALAIPVEGRDGKQPGVMSDPLRTMTTRAETAMVTPFIAELRGGGSDARTIDDPAATFCASGNHHGLVTPYYGTADTAYSSDAALGTLTTRDRYALVTRHNGSKGDGAEMSTPIHEAMRTLTTTAQQSILTPGDLAAAEARVDDCMFRMLEPHEVAAGMAFPGDYLWEGTRRERVKMAGNAVTPPAARDLIGAVVDALSGAA